MQPKYAGMTANERIYVSGLMDEFDKAVSEKKTDEVIRILKTVELGDDSIEPILEQLGLRIG
jgi:reverse gyrase